MRNTHLNSFLAVGLWLIVTTVVSADESEDTTEAPVDPKLAKIVQEIGLDLKDIQEVLRGTILTAQQYKSLQRGTAVLIQLNPTKDEFMALDESFKDGVTTAEFLKFLLEHGKSLKIPKHKEKSETSDTGPVEEVVVYAYSFNSVPMDPSEFNISDIYQLRSIRARANELYREGRYKEAFPLLLGLAKRGFRDSQSRLAYILLNGADGVPKSNLRAIGWLGAASSSPTEPRFRVLFKKHMRRIPADVLDTVNQVVEAYRREFGHSDHWQCSTNHPYYAQSSIIKSVHCKLKLEALADACRPGKCWVHDVNNEWGDSRMPGLDRLDRRIEEMLNSRLPDALNYGSG